MKIFKILLASILTIGCISFVEAQKWDPAPTQSLDMEMYPEGLSSVEVIGKLKINRQCQDFVTLEKNGIIVKQIPASNKIAVYTFDEYTKLNNDEAGNLHITFCEDVKNTLFNNYGIYKVTIPAGFFYLADGLLNEAMSGEWKIDNAKMIVTPSTGSILNDLNSITIDFPEASKVEARYPVNIVFEPKIEMSSSKEELPILSVDIMPSITGTSASIILSDQLIETIKNSAGKLTLTCNPGTYSVYYGGSDTPSNTAELITTYTINSLSGDINGGYWVEPDPAGVTKFESFMVCDNFTCDTNLSRQCYFILYPPQGKQITQVGKANAYLYEVIDGVRQNTPLKYFSGQKYNIITNGAIMFYLAGQPSTPGTIYLSPGKYQIVVGKNADYSNHNPELVFDYTIKADPNVSPISSLIVPATDVAVNSLDRIKVSFPDAKNVEIKKGTYATITSGNIEYTAEVTLNSEEECPIIEIIPYAPLTLKGSYEVSIPISNVTVDEIPYRINIKYEVTGNDHTTGIINADENPYVCIYSLQGNIIARNVTSEFLNTLSPGVYIVNGQKVVIR